MLQRKRATSEGATSAGCASGRPRLNAGVLAKLTEHRMTSNLLGFRSVDHLALRRCVHAEQGLGRGPFWQAGVLDHQPPALR